MKTSLPVCALALACFAAQAHAQSMFRGDPAHSGLYASQGPREFHRVKWKFPTGASIVVATSPRQRRLKWNDPRIRPWILAGVVAGHAQAATLTCMGFFVIDRLALEPHGSESSIAIVMMAGASADALTISPT